MLIKALSGALIALWLLGSTQAKAITVFACEPEWAALTKALMPEAIVRSATTHLQDPHHIEARPSLIAQLRGADFAICTGAELEAGWLPMLQERAGNPRLSRPFPAMFTRRAILIFTPIRKGSSWLPKPSRSDLVNCFPATRLRSIRIWQPSTLN